MYKVLIVDDDLIICKGLIKLINWERYGFEAGEYALNGQEALKLASTVKYDLIITDVRMPKLDGIELIKSLRLSGNASKIIILSGFKDFEYAQAAVEFGVKKYVLKPVNEKALVDTILDIRDEIDKSIKQDHMIHESRIILKEKAILDLIAGGEKNEQAGAMAKEAGIELDYEGFSVCVIGVCGDSCNSRRSASGLLKKMIAETVNKYVPCYIADIGDHKLAAVICLRGVPAVDLKPVLEEVLQIVYNHTGYKVNIAVGNNAPKPEFIFESFKNACGILESEDFDEQHRVLYFDDIADRNIGPIIKYIRENCCERLSLRSIARKFYINPVYLGRVFKSHTGIRFNDFLTGCKMEYALKLLESNKFMVGEISEKVGYSDYNHFCRVFKNKIGCTPSEYRSNRNLSRNFSSYEYKKLN